MWSESHILFFTRCIDGSIMYIHQIFMKKKFFFCFFNIILICYGSANCPQLTQLHMWSITKNWRDMRHSDLQNSQKKCSLCGCFPQMFFFEWSMNYDYVDFLKVLDGFIVWQIWPILLYLAYCRCCTLVICTLKHA